MRPNCVTIFVNDLNKKICRVSKWLKDTWSLYIQLTSACLMTWADCCWIWGHSDSVLLSWPCFSTSVFQYFWADRVLVLLSWPCFNTCLVRITSLHPDGVQIKFIYRVSWPDFSRVAALWTLIFFALFSSPFGVRSIELLTAVVIFMMVFTPPPPPAAHENTRLAGPKLWYNHIGGVN